MKRIVVLLCLAIGLSACNSGKLEGQSSKGAQSAQPATTSSPAKSVESMLSMLGKGEIQSAKKFLNKEMQRRNFAMATAQEFTTHGIKSLKVYEKSVKGEIAYVVALYERNDGFKGQILFDMQREGNEWYVAGVH